MSGKKGKKSLRRVLVEHTYRFLFGCFFKKTYLPKDLNRSLRALFPFLIQAIFFQKLLRINSKIPWPVHHSSQFVISDMNNISFPPSFTPQFMSHGCYWQAIGKISIGQNVWVGPNVGFITSNHDPNNPAKRMPAENISIGKNSWIGMNSVILPGVMLAENTIVGAGSVVTHSFEEGHIIIGGCPAKIIKRLK